MSKALKSVARLLRNCRASSEVSENHFGIGDPTANSNSDIAFTSDQDFQSDWLQDFANPFVNPPTLTVVKTRISPYALLLLIGSAKADLFIYEPFDYTPPNPPNNDTFLGDGNQAGGLGLGEWSQLNTGTNEADVAEIGLYRQCSFRRYLLQFKINIYILTRLYYYLL